MTPSEPVRLHVEAGVGEIVLARRERRNAVDPGMAARLKEVVAQAGEMEDVRAVLLYGDGSSFSSGGDLRALEAMGDDDALRLMGAMSRTLEDLRSLPKAVIAWIEGDAVGGGVEIALASDVIWAHPAARVAPIQVSLGLLPGWGGWSLLRDRMGAARARAILLEARRMEAAEALSLGLVDRILPGIHAARAEARRIASWPLGAVRALKTISPQNAAEVFPGLWRDPARRERMGRPEGRDGTSPP